MMRKREITVEVSLGLLTSTLKEEDIYPKTFIELQKHSHN